MGIWLNIWIAIAGVIAGAIFTWIIGWIQNIITQERLLKKMQHAVFDREQISVSEEFLMTRLLAKKIQEDNFKPDVIFALCPGGAMIAEWLSRGFLGNRSTPIPVQLLYMVREQGGMGVIIDKAVINENLTAIPSGLSKSSKVLFVNDITRGGHTLGVASEFLKEHFPDGDIRSATLICSKNANVKPIYYVAMTAKVVRFEWKIYEE
jgi:hypoxanthine phosphoribosyltransferase